MEEIYPVTIIKSRYGGSYEGSEWIAINENASEEILSEMLGDDCTCYNIYKQLFNKKITIKNAFDENIIIGQGNTPQEAYENLISKRSNI